MPTSPFLGKRVSLSILIGLSLALSGCLCPKQTPALPQHAVRRPHMDSWFGTTPTIDGRIEPGEWADASAFQGVREWTAEFTPVTRDSDLSLRGWVKHDEAWLYFAFEVTDDTLYGIDTPRWLPAENALAHTLTPEGFPWFGDELELLVNAPNRWTGEEDCDGSGASWQMVCNLTKSRLGGIGVGGLLEGEPRVKPEAWAIYQGWIQQGAQRASVSVKPGGRGYSVEWAVRFNPCVEVAPGVFHDPKRGSVTIGLNIALGDLDEPERGKGNFGQFHHEQWWAGAQGTRTQKNNFGTLTLHGLNTRRP